jgi:hypothetical protein
MRPSCSSRFLRACKPQSRIFSAVFYPGVCAFLPDTRSYEEELLALQNFQQKRLKLEEALVEANNFIDSERARHKQALQVR